MRTIRTLLGLCALSLLLAGAALAQDNGSSYPWRGSISAPQAYPVEIYEGALSGPDRTYSFSPIWGLINAGWGESGGTFSTGDGRYKLPHTLAITWYSVKEQRFYQGRWPLDRAAIEVVWREGVLNPRTGRRADFHTLLVGLAPRGKVVLWAESGSGQVQLASFQAAPTTLDPTQAREDFQYFFRDNYRQAAHAPAQLYPPELLTRWQVQGWPAADQFDRYPQPYRWRFEANAYQGAGPRYFYARSFSGERTSVAGEGASAWQARPLPAHVYAVWRGADGREYVADFKFDYDVIRAAFERLGGPGAEVALRFDVNDDNASLFAVSARGQMPVPYVEGSWVSD